MRRFTITPLTRRRFLALAGRVDAVSKEINPWLTGIAVALSLLLCSALFARVADPVAPDVQHQTLISPTGQ
jgi:hypothetical protein